MAYDLLVAKKIDPATLSDQVRAVIGDTKYVFSAFDNDIHFDTTLKTITCTGTNLLVQWILKTLLTAIGEHFEDPKYGVGDFGIGEKMSDSLFADIRSSVYSALAHSNNIRSGGNADPDELIGNIDSVSVIRDDKDPRRIFVYISVVTQGGKYVDVAVTRTL
jgi:hypothetical protein